MVVEILRCDFSNFWWVFRWAARLCGPLAYGVRYKLVTKLNLKFWPRWTFWPRRVFSGPHPGPDYYAAATYNGLPDYERIAVGWANSWAYGQDIPTSPWRSSMSIPRKYSLATIGSKARLVQEPYDMVPLERSPALYTQSWDTLTASILNIPVKGKSLDVTLTFQIVLQRPATSTTSTKTSAITTLTTGYPCARGNRK